MLAKLTGKRQVVFLCIELQNKAEFQLPPFLIELPGSVKIGRWTMSRIFHKKLNTMKYPRPASEAELSIYHLLPFLFHLFEDLYSALALRPFSSFIILESAYLQVHLLRRRYIFKESASVMAKCFALRKSLLKYHFGGIYESKCKQARIRAKKFPGLLPAFVKGC